MQKRSLATHVRESRAEGVCRGQAGGAGGGTRGRQRQGRGGGAREAGARGRGDRRRRAPAPQGRMSSATSGIGGSKAPALPELPLEMVRWRLLLSSLSSMAAMGRRGISQCAGCAPLRAGGGARGVRANPMEGLPQLRRNCARRRRWLGFWGSNVVASRRVALRRSAPTWRSSYAAPPPFAAVWNLGLRSPTHALRSHSPRSAARMRPRTPP